MQTTLLQLSLTQKERKNKTNSNRHTTSKSQIIASRKTKTNNYRRNHTIKHKTKQLKQTASKRHVSKRPKQAITNHSKTTPTQLTQKIKQTKPIP